MTNTRIAIVFACDDKYFFHCRNLLASIAKNAPSMAACDRYCVSPGLSPEHQEELAQYGVHYRPFTLDVFPTALADIVSKHEYTFGQFIRPLFPTLIPGYDNYLYMDCDTWVQNDSLLPSIEHALHVSPEHIVVAPMVSHYYPAALNDLKMTVSVQESWTYGTYDTRVSRIMSNRTFYSSGVFALSATSPVWEMWWHDILDIGPKVALCNPLFLHFAEQTALNGVIARTGKVCVLDPLFNYHCNMGGVVRDSGTGLVLSVWAKPVREICVVHLAAWSTLKDDYTAGRLVFEP